MPEVGSDSTETSAVAVNAELRPDDPQETPTLGRVFSETAALWRAHFAVFIATSVVASAPLLLDTIVSGTPLARSPRALARAALAMAVGSLQLALITLEIRDIRAGRPLDFPHYLRVVASRLGALTAVATPLILMAVLPEAHRPGKAGADAGLNLLIGGLCLAMIYLALIWSLAACSLVDGRRNIASSLRHSQALTKGIRWKIAWCFVLIGSVPTVALISLRRLFPHTFTAGSALEALVSALVSSFVPIVLAVIYLDRVTASKAPQTEELALVFD